MSSRAGWGEFGWIWLGLVVVCGARGVLLYAGVHPARRQLLSLMTVPIWRTLETPGREVTDTEEEMEDNELVMAVANEVVRRLESCFASAVVEPEYITLAEVQRRTSFSYDFVYDAVRRGDLPATQKGRDWRVAVKDMRAWMEKDRAANHIPARSELKKKVNSLMPGLAT
jgi:excisionase family DNA binding protein